MFLECEYIGKCASCTLGEYSYETQLEIKIQEPINYFNNILQTTQDNTSKVFKSDTRHFRLRAKFRIYHHKDSGDISYAMSDYDKKVLPIKQCLIVSKPIHKLMSKVIVLLNDDSNMVLKKKLFEINFISDDKGVLITLLYHKVLDETYNIKSLNMSKMLNKLGIGNIRIIGRYAKNKVISQSDEVFVSLSVEDKQIEYIYKDDSFMQPNTKTNKQMLGWIRSQLKDIKDIESKTLIELYCGVGNFSLALSDMFKQVLASEISKKFIVLAQQNAKNNDIKNIEFLRMSAKDFSDAKNGVREFRRCSHIQLDNYPIDCMLIDPPRAGLDEVSLTFVQKANLLIYISCNFDSLVDNLKVLLKTHKLIDYALFDQFAYTKHLEVGVLLQKLD
jgi:tRNA (uracil-5-)-methyltransferase